MYTQVSRFRFENSQPREVSEITSPQECRSRRATRASHALISAAFRRRRQQPQTHHVAKGTEFAYPGQCASIDISQVPEANTLQKRRTLITSYAIPIPCCPRLVKESASPRRFVQIRFLKYTCHWWHDMEPLCVAGTCWGEMYLASTGCPRNNLTKTLAYLELCLHTFASVRIEKTRHFVRDWNSKRHSLCHFYICGEHMRVPCKVPTRIAIGSLCICGNTQVDSGPSFPA